MKSSSHTQRKDALSSRKGINDPLWLLAIAMGLFFAIMAALVAS